MKTFRATMAVVLMGLALTAFQPDALAQARRGGAGSNASRSTSSPRSTSRSQSSVTRTSQSRPDHKTTVNKSNDRKPGESSVRKPNGAATRPSNTTVQQTRPASGTRPSSTVTRPANSRKPSPATKPSAVTRPAPSGKPQQKPSAPAYKPGIKPPHRDHPRERDFLHYSKPSYYWTSHNHFYGHRVKMLPSYAHRHVHHGITYYCYNDIWYRPYGGYYVVCRPPFGTVLAANLIADMAWAAVRISYYNTVAQTYSQLNENNEYIAQQNAQIAQNNAIIAAQNAQIAAGQQQAQQAYLLADQLGLIQSYAAAGSTYYYQDGVFYSMGADGQYSVIVPPAGALVESLSEDFDIVTLSDGNEYYKVDDTIYKVTVVDGIPYFEVLGQLY